MPAGGGEELRYRRCPQKATRPGLEPGTREPKSLVLPLHHRVGTSTTTTVCYFVVEISARGVAAGESRVAQDKLFSYMLYTPDFRDFPHQVFVPACR